jgi:hypothetical protein
MRGKSEQKSVTNESKRARSRNRAKHKCPGDLERLIELVNLIPVDRPLPHVSELMKISGEDDQHLDALVREKLTELPEKLWRIQTPVVKYIRFRKLRMDMHEMAQYGSLSEMQQIRYQMEVGEDREKFRKDFKAAFGDNPWHERTQFDTDSSYYNWRPPKLEVNLDIDRDTGLWRAGESDPLNALVGVEASRLRECKVCQQIFWAHQDNMVACTSRCSATNRQRLLRKNRQQYQEALEKKRNAKPQKQAK